MRNLGTPKHKCKKRLRSAKSTPSHSHRGKRGILDPDAPSKKGFHLLPIARRLGWCFWGTECDDEITMNQRGSPHCFAFPGCASTTPKRKKKGTSSSLGHFAHLTSTQKTSRRETYGIKRAPRLTSSSYVPSLPLTISRPILQNNTPEKCEDEKFSCKKKERGRNHPQTTVPLVLALDKLGR